MRTVSSRLSPIGFLGHFGKKSLETPGFPGKRRKRHAETTESSGKSRVNELRAEIAAPFLASQLGIPVLTDMAKLTNHRKHVARWVEAMNADATLIFRTAAAASQ